MATDPSANESGTTPSSSSSCSAATPIACQVNVQLGMFRVLRAKGKALSSGGFGVAMLSSTKGDGDGDSLKQDHLFPEEAVFLHERGLLECRDEEGSLLDSSQLYQYLPILGMSLAMFLVYAHLRSQDFRVLRHAKDRLALLRAQVDDDRLLRQQVRTSIQMAPPPTLTNMTLHWDCYAPDSRFGKTHPGIPAFYVAASYYNESHVRFPDLVRLLLDAQEIPLKIATVSDSGTVVMFGVAALGVPSMSDHVGEDDDEDE